MKTTTNTLSQLRELTTIVADTGELQEIKDFQPQDATTNPSLIYQAVQVEEYKHFLNRAIQNNKNSALSGNALYDRVIDDLLVDFGSEILDIIPGRVSTEVSAHLSFDIEHTIKKAYSIIALYENRGIARERVLVKIAATWEGIEAAKILTKEGIHCNMTLVFSMSQAVACAEANVQLVSPFVGRIMDWHVRAKGRTYKGYEDPGVLSVQSIYHYYKKHDYQTEIMAASFRNIEEVIELAGCDLLTISPHLLKALKNTNELISPRLTPRFSASLDIKKINMNERIFRWMLNEDAMTTEKLAEGIRNFYLDTIKLEEQIARRIL